jgi:phage tail tape-measure protein
VSKVASALANPATADIVKDLAKNSLKGINVVSAGLTTAQVVYDIGHGKAASRALAEGGGSLVGGAVGGAIGSLIPIPVVGTAVGSLVGSYLGGKVGDWLADRAGAPN